jgi:hypothetical protein
MCLIIVIISAAYCLAKNSPPNEKIAFTWPTKFRLRVYSFARAQQRSFFPRSSWLRVFWPPATKIHIASTYYHFLWSPNDLAHISVRRAPPDPRWCCLRSCTNFRVQSPSRPTVSIAVQVRKNTKWKHFRYGQKKLLELSEYAVHARSAWRFGGSCPDPGLASVVTSKHPGSRQYPLSSLELPNCSGIALQISGTLTGCTGDLPLPALFLVFSQFTFANFRPRDFKESVSTALAAAKSKPEHSKTCIVASDMYAWAAHILLKIESVVFDVLNVVILSWTAFALVMSLCPHCLLRYDAWYSSIGTCL